MSKTQTAPAPVPGVGIPETLTELLSSPFAAAAREMLEHHGVINLDGDGEFTAAISELDPNGKEDDELEAGIDLLRTPDAENANVREYLAARMDDAFTGRVARAWERAYLFGLAVGLQLGRIGGGR